jgi:hypothetical protein
MVMPASFPDAFANNENWLTGAVGISQTSTATSSMTQNQRIEC